MKKYTILSIFSILTLHFHGQEVIDVMELEPAKWSTNVTVAPMTSDSLVSSFLIWIESGVAAHFHSRHTEHVYVLEGAGQMQLGDTTVQIAAGQLIFIPRGTVHAVEVTSEETMKVISIQTPEFKGIDRVFVRPDQDSK